MANINKTPNKGRVIINIIFVLTMIIILQSCKSPTGPESLQPGSRNYTWAVDTLNIPYTVLECIWGSSPTDVWAVGPGGDLDKTIYHFDGSKWYNDGISRPLAPQAVFGFSSNDVWFGDDGFNSFWHYNGTTLSKFQDYTIPGYSNTGIINIWGENPDNVYAAGYADSNNIYIGVIQHYTGIQWKIIYTSPHVSTYEVFAKICGNIPEGNDYILSYYGVNADTNRLYEIADNKLKLIYSDATSSTGSANISLIGKQVYFVIGNNICKWENNSFSPIFNVPETSFSHSIYGRNGEDIFLEMTDGIAQYNGTDIQYIYKFSHPQIGLSSAVIFDKEVFFLAYDFQNQLNLIIRGTLN